MSTAVLAQQRPWDNPINAELVTLRLGADEAPFSLSPLVSRLQPHPDIYGFYQDIEQCLGCLYERITLANKSWMCRKEAFGFVTSLFPLSLSDAEAVFGQLVAFPDLLELAVGDPDLLTLIHQLHSSVIVRLLNRITKGRQITFAEAVQERPEFQGAARVPVRIREVWNPAQECLVPQQATLMETPQGPILHLPAVIQRARVPEVAAHYLRFLDRSQFSSSASALAHAIRNPDRLRAFASERRYGSSR